jgi:4-amino-4-deoxy-L-arabinose transferase-like glycosyltransferase
MAAGAIVLVALAAIVHTWTVFSQTVDEPAHVAAGAEWWSGTYELDPQHPPLARILVAIGPLLRGAHYERLSHWLFSGNAILYGAGDYLATLASARAGTPVFFLLGCWIAFAWTRELYGDAAALAALTFFALQPTVLAHAGLATTDMAAAATILAALYAYTHERPALLGLAIAAAVASKFSAIVFLPVAMIAMQALQLAVGSRQSTGVHHRPADNRDSSRVAWGPPAYCRLQTANFLTLAIAILAVLAIYRFDAGAFVRGIQDLRAHNAAGHPSYLFGEVRREGWWYYFPVALWFKTTIPLLIAFAYGIRKQTAALVAAFAAILAVAMLSRISIGVRHVLPLYPLMAMIAAYGITRMRRPVAIAAIVAQIATFALAHPDHLAYFNLTAGRDPSRILLDSNLDWGQDLLRLEKACARRGIDTLHLAYFGSADLRRHHLPKLAALPPFTPVQGWIAISEMNLKDLGARNRKRGAYDWLRRYEPVERIGKSILLYRVQPDPPAAVYR